MAHTGKRDAEVAAILGVARSYVTHLRNKIRTPSLSMALRIYRQLDGLKLGPLVGASKAEIAALSRVHSRRAA